MFKIPFRAAPSNGLFLPLGPNPDFEGERSVTMRRTVARSGHYEYLAGRTYYLDAEKADEFILKGYADGSLSREYTDDDRLNLLATVQTVNL
jgi:hypothetical protein